MVASSNGVGGSKAKTLRIVLYHPKDIANVRDFLSICRALGCSVLAVPRSSNIDEVCSLATCIDSIESFLDPACTTIVLETVGTTTPPRICTECVNIVLGAEDYGLPENVVKELRERGAQIVRLAMSRYGVSYNVVTSLVMFLTDLELSSHWISRRSTSCGSPYP